MRMILTMLMLAGLSATVGYTADAKAGQAIYSKSCKSCHGPDGTPNPAVSKMLKVEMKDLKSAEVQAMTLGDIKTIVTDGKGKMKPVKTVSGTGADDVAAYVHSMK